MRRMRPIVGWFIALLFVLTRADGQETTSSWTVRAGGGLGVGVVAMPALTDYVNVVALSANPVDDFVSVAELSAFAELRLNDLWSMGLSWGRVAKSIEPSGPDGWTFDAEMIVPLVFVRRAVDMSGMRLLLTAGGGPAHGELTQRYGPIGSEQGFSGSGLGLLVGAATFAPLDDHIEAGIAVDLRWSGVRRLTSASGLEPSHRGTTADLRWTQLTLQFLIAATF